MIIYQTVVRDDGNYWEIKHWRRKRDAVRYAKRRARLGVASAEATRIVVDDALTPFELAQVFGDISFNHFISGGPNRETLFEYWY